MTAVLVNVAEAVKAELVAAPDGTFSQTFTPVRSYADWELPLKAATKLLCDIVPGTAPKTDLDDNESVSYRPFADIVFRQRFSTEAQNEDTGKVELDNIDALVLLVQEVHRFFTMHRLEDFEDAVCQVPEIVMAFSPTHLRQFRQFTSIVRIPFTANIDV